MEAARRAQQIPAKPVRITNREGRSPIVLICDHASNFLPAQYATLGLDNSDLTRHIAWDPGALPVAARMAQALDAVLVESVHFAAGHRLQPAARCAGPDFCRQRNHGHPGKCRPLGR